MTSANSGIDIHVDADGLIRDNRERLRFRAETLGYSDARSYGHGPLQSG